MSTPLLDVVRDWSWWDRPRRATVPRGVELPAALSETLCLVVQGVRRCGKSTLLGQLVDRYGLDPLRCAFLNFEDPRLVARLDWTVLDELVTAFRARHDDDQPLYFFLDEIQHVDGWQRWLRAQLDRPRGHVFTITGSNAHLLSGELSTSLTGRHLVVELFPFDLDELRTADPAADLAAYLAHGGFPEPVGSPDRDRLLRQYFADIVERDVRERAGARSALPVRQVVQMVFEAAGSELSLRRVAAATGLAIETAGAYLAAAESAYVVLSCPYFAFSERRRASRNKKYYPVDTGLRRVCVTRTGEDRGKSLECATHLALRRRFGPVFYWRERGEVDFVVHHEGRIIPVQVCSDGPQERHHRAIESFYERFPQAEETVWVSFETFEEELARLD